MEYKRQVNQSSASRLRSLTSQMSFRLDQGHGTCVYRVGVEDDGCHSLLDYQVVAKSCCVLEYLARGLNSVVTERIMIQNEVTKTDDGVYVKIEGSDAARIREPAVLGDSMGRKDEISPEHARRIQAGGPTRAEITIQKVETHDLDPPAIPLSQLDDTTADVAEAAVSKGHAKKETTPAETKRPNVGETMSARNIRVAVVGNVDAGKSSLIGVSANHSVYRTCVVSLAEYDGLTLFIHDSAFDT